MQVKVTDTYPIVQTKQGKVHGIDVNGVLTFRGIPYAKAERFAAPVPPDAWDGVRDCFVWGDTAPYPGLLLSTLFSSHRYWVQSENCQNLNIWTTSMDENAKKPVMFSIHGGGYFSGSSTDEAITEGDGLAGTGEVVVVSINHRLNCLGLMDLRKYGPRFADSANACLLDIIAALKWVQENITAFGGDPGNVTLFGQSGGGGKIMSLMQMKAADGLYHKAIIQSGVMTNRPSCKLGAEHADRTIAHLGLDEASIMDIIDVPYNDLYDAFRKAAQDMGYNEIDLSCPHPDDDALLYDYSVAGFRPETAEIPVLVGSCIAESSLFTSKGLKPPMFSSEDKATLTLEEKTERLRKRFGGQAEKVAELIAQTYPHLDPLYAEALSNRSGILNYANARSEQANAPVFNYLFTYLVPALEGKLAWHGADLGFTFGTLDKSETLCSGGEEAYALMEKMRDAWISFAKNGTPAIPALPDWPAYTTDAPYSMLFDVDCRAEMDHDKELTKVLFSLNDEPY